MDGNKLLHHQLSVAQQLLREERDKNAALLTEIHGPRGWKVTCSRYATLAASLHRAATAYRAMVALLSAKTEQPFDPENEEHMATATALVARFDHADKTLAAVLASVPPPP